jgi:hypothetical protein
MVSKWLSGYGDPDLTKGRMLDYDNIQHLNMN